jgi:hypothetical protein
LFWVIGISFRIKMRMGIEGAGGGVKLLDDTSKECLQAAFLRGSHRVGNEEVGQADQSLTDGLQAFLAVDEGRRSGGVGVRFRAQKIQGSLKEGTAVLFVRHPEGADQRESFAELQPVAADAGKKGILFRGSHDAQGVSHGGAECSRRQCVLRHGGETFGDLHAARHPLGLSAQQPCDGGGAQSIVVYQGSDHACLIECGEGAGR